MSPYKTKINRNSRTNAPPAQQPIIGHSGRQRIGQSCKILQADN